MVQWASLLPSVKGIDCHDYQSIVIGKCILIDSFPQHIGQAAIFGSPSVKAMVTDNGYRWIACTVYCGRQRLSIDTSHNLWWPAMAIDGHSSAQSAVVHNLYGLTVSPVYCHTYNVVHYLVILKNKVLVIQSTLCDSNFIYLLSYARAAGD